MANIVLDANVIVAWVDPADSLHARGAALLERLQADGHDAVLLDVLVGEAVSVLCRRFEERKRGADLPGALAKLRAMIGPSDVTWIGGETARLYEAILDVVGESEGKLNFNDALLVLLQREGRIGAVATFDADFESVPGFTLVGEPRKQDTD